MFQQCLELLLIVSLSLLNIGTVTTTNSVLHLSGATQSYVQYPSWRQFFADNAPSDLVGEVVKSVSFSLDFRYDGSTNKPHYPTGGLLFYADDETGIGGVYVELKLLSDSNLRVRIDDSASVRMKNIIELHREINFTDGHWHRLELTRHFQHQLVDDFSSNEERIVPITFKVDSETIHKKIELSHKRTKPNTDSFYCHHKDNAVFIGGVPNEYQHHFLAHLALPTVAYELHFHGSIRNVYHTSLYEDNESSMQLQSPISSNGSLESIPSKQSCDKCHHGGYCYFTNTGTFCDCSFTDYEGTHCQKRK